jgi:hypothetical protein
VLGVEVADRELNRVIVAVEVQAVDPEQRLARLPAQVPGGGLRRAGRADALLRGGDGAGHARVDEADDRDPAPPARRGQLVDAGQQVPDARGQVDRGVAERDAGVQADERGREDLVGGEPEAAGRLDVDPAVQRADDLALGVQRQRHQFLDGAEVVDVPVFFRDRVRAAPGDPVDDALRDQVLHRAPDGLPADREAGRQLLLGRQLPAARVLAVTDGVPDLRRERPVGGGPDLFWHNDSMPWG